MKPKEINILGVKYKIDYVDNPAEVDQYKRESLWGQIDYWTRTIRIYSNGRPIEDIFQTLLHEILHGIESQLKIRCFKDTNGGHDDLDILALALTDVLVRNDMIKLKD
jgi:hypothetical protein